MQAKARAKGTGENLRESRRGNLPKICHSRKPNSELYLEMGPGLQSCTRQNPLRAGFSTLLLIRNGMPHNSLFIHSGVKSSPGRPGFPWGESPAERAVPLVRSARFAVPSSPAKRGVPRSHIPLSRTRRCSLSSRRDLLRSRHFPAG